MAGIVKLLESTITSAVSTLSLDNVFIDTYDVFMIKCELVGSDTDSVTLRMRFIHDDGTIDTNSSYETATLQLADFSTSISKMESNNKDQFFLSRISMGTSQSEFTNLLIYCFNTRLSEHTNIATLNVTHDSSADMKWERGQGYHEQNEKIRGVQLFSSSGDLDNGKFVVYGFKKS